MKKKSRKEEKKERKEEKKKKTDRTKDNRQKTTERARIEDKNEGLFVLEGWELGATRLGIKKERRKTENKDW